MKIKYKEVHAFRQGLTIGAQDGIVDIDDHLKASRFTHYTKKYERDAFTAGYALGNRPEYAQLYMDGGSLIRYAEEAGDVQPVGWAVYVTFNSTYIKEM